MHDDLTLDQMRHITRNAALSAHPPQHETDAERHYREQVENEIRENQRRRIANDMPWDMAD